MPVKTFLAISGSLRRSSHNTGLLRALQTLAPVGVTIDLYQGLGSLPFFSQDLENGAGPAAVADLRRRVREADGVIIATPEYNSAIPGVLMNALDWLSRPADGDPVLRDKPTAILGASPSQFGTAPWPAGPAPDPAPHPDSCRCPSRGHRLPVPPALLRRRHLRRRRLHREPPAGPAGGAGPADRAQVPGRHRLTRTVTGPALAGPAWALHRGPPVVMTDTVTDFARRTPP
ncbi:NADPH-dependent FMN reductase [Streptomyces sp. CS62]|uniref:NADPH-dependent FMN reductase n=1 Tax=Streptomyces sp. CS62 TaxID=3119268 RepID=UPI002F95E41B